MGLIVTTIFYNIYFNNNHVRLVIMSEDTDKDNPLNFKAGWYSEPNVEYVIEPDDEDKGILESIKEFFRLLF